jgi:hypothetical protein
MEASVGQLVNGLQRARTTASLEYQVAGSE